MIVFRHADPRFPFLWETPEQPPGRWHGKGEGPAHYLADTPDGAWAELIRHEEIHDAEDLSTIRRALWAIEIDEAPGVRTDLTAEAMTGGPETYGRCRAEAARLRAAGAIGLQAPSAALVAGGARGSVVDGGMKPSAPRDGLVYVLFGRRSDITGWAVVRKGYPPVDLLERVRHF